MTDRIDARIYREALAELRDLHPEEFDEIRRRKLARFGLKPQSTRSEGHLKRRQVFEFVRDQIIETGVAPSAALIGRSVGLSGEAARTHVIRLVEQGQLERLPGNTTATLPVDPSSS